MIKLSLLVVVCLLGCSSSHGSENRKPIDKGKGDAGASTAGKDSRESGTDDKGDAAAGAGGAAGETEGDPNCQELRGCCNAMGGADRGSCLATLASIESGTQPAADCSSALDGLVEAGSCPCQSASCSCGTASCATGELCRNGRCGSATTTTPDAGASAPPGECMTHGKACSRNVDCCGWTMLQAFCVSVGTQPTCLKACSDATDCASTETCHEITDRGNSVCAPL